MAIRETPALSAARSRQPVPEQPDATVPEDSAQRQQNAGKPAAAKAVKSSGAIVNHKGKLAIGAAAMLGLAVFYKWRDSKLARENPEEYARLRRLRAAVGTDEGKSKKER